MNQAFQHYEHLRNQQIHFNRIVNPEVRVPKHQAFKPIKANTELARVKQRLNKQASIQRQNMHIMKKLFTINTRKPALSMSHSTSSLPLPPVIIRKRPFEIPQHENENNKIALRLIKSKSSINVKKQLKDHHDKQKIKKSLSKYHSMDGENGLQLINRKKYVAELMMMKKLKMNEQAESRVKNYIANNNGGSRVTKISSQRDRSQIVKG